MSLTTNLLNVVKVELEVPGGESVDFFLNLLNGFTFSAIWLELQEMS